MQINADRNIDDYGIYLNNFFIPEINDTNTSLPENITPLLQISAYIFQWKEWFPPNIKWLDFDPQRALKIYFKHYNGPYNNIVHYIVGFSQIIQM